ncbi:AraC family transcriptional regulator [Faecalicatena orotica]
MKKFTKKTVGADGKRNRKIIRKIEQKRTFRKIFLTITIAMFIVVILCFSIMYGIVKKIIMEQNIDSSAQQFRQIQEEFEVANEQINMVATQVILDDICSDWMLAGEARSFNSLDIARIRKQLAVFKNTSSMIESIYIYNGKIDKFLSTDGNYSYTGKAGFSDLGIVEILNDYDNYYSRNLFKRERVIRNSLGTEVTDSVYTYVLNNTQDSQVTSAIVVNLDLTPLFAKVLGMEAMQESQMVIVDGKDEMWAELQNFSDLDMKMDSHLLNLIEGNDGHAETSYDAERYFVSWMHSDKTDWDYLKVTKWDTMFARLLELQKWAFFICAFILLAVAGGSAFSSFSIYRLYGQLERKNFIKNGMKISESNKLKENFLYEFIHKRKTYGNAELTERLEQLGYPMRAGKLFTVLLLQLEDYHSFIEEFGQDGAYDVKYSVRNIFEEIFNMEFHVSGLINRDNTIVFILSAEDGESVDTGRIEGKFREFCDKIKPFGEWTFSLIGSEEFLTAEKIPELAEKLYQVKEESFFYPSNMFLTYERICEEHSGSVNYRKLDLGKLTDTLRGGKDVWEQYQIFAESLECYSSKEYMNAMIWLGVSLVRDMKEFYMTDADQEYTLNHFLAQLAKCDKKVQVDKQFEKVFSNMLQIQESANVKKGVTGKMEEIQEYIQKNYSNMNIALEFLGDEFGVSANYLGRVFKKETGVSVSEYLNSVRLQKVLEGLENTEKPAKDIAQACGFASINYFYTYFRKKMGVTPQAYRQQLRSREK